MSRYDWSKAPDWVKFIATNKNGMVGMHENEPRKGKEGWVSLKGRMEVICQEDWAESLEERPMWKPSVGEYFWTISVGTIRAVKKLRWYSDESYNILYERELAFQTREEAEAKAREWGLL